MFVARSTCRTDYEAYEIAYELDDNAPRTCVILYLLNMPLARLSIQA